MTLQITPLTPVFGARVEGFSMLAEDAGRKSSVDDATYREIRQAFEQYSVLHFPHQNVDDQAQIAFSEMFGPLENSAIGINGAGSKLVVISNIQADGSLLPVASKRMKFTKANEQWHTDSTFKKIPALASMLSARVIPAEGGDTEYACLWAAYEDLPMAMKTKLENLVAVHSIEVSRGRVDPNAVSQVQKDAMPPVEQSVIRVNPVNGRRACSLCSHVAEILGMSAEEGQNLVDELVAHATQPKYLYRHVWQSGDVVMWDNRMTLHRGCGYDETRHRRTMVRSTISDFGATAAAGRVIRQPR